MYFRNSKKMSGDVSLSEAIESDKDGNPLTLMDVISCEEDIIENLDRKMKCGKIGEYIKETLSLREREIIELRYGLNGEEPLTQREIAAKLGISRSYVSRIEKRALQLLKKRFDLAEKKHLQ